GACSAAEPRTFQPVPCQHHQEAEHVGHWHCTLGSGCGCTSDLCACRPWWMGQSLAMDGWCARMDWFYLSCHGYCWVFTYPWTRWTNVRRLSLLFALVFFGHIWCITILTTHLFLF